MAVPSSSRFRYQKIIEALEQEIRSGRFGPGQKLPSEAALVKKFDTSRITIGRALRELQNKGLVTRRAGSGTYVAEAASLPAALLFGLLIPDLGETDVFDPICRGLASAPVGEHALLWGHTDARQVAKTDQCRQLYQQFISRKVSGVFFAPLEFECDAEKTNREVLVAFKAANIPVVLLDHGPAAKPEAIRVDLVGLNNHQAGYVATEHLVRLGCKHIGFLAAQGATMTIKAREAGYLDALRHYGQATGPSSVIGATAEQVPIPVSQNRQIDGLVCINDRVAASMMQVYLAQGIRIPEDIRLVGIDDVPYAELLPVPLTTVRQPCRQIGEAAMQVMLDRMRQPRMPVRETLLSGELIIRKSCGSA